MKNRFLAPLGLTVAAAFLLTSCAGTGQEAAPTAGGANGGGDLTFAVVTHSSTGDAFWDRVKSGAETAGGQYGATVTSTPTRIPPSSPSSSTTPSRRRSTGSSSRWRTRTA